MPISLPPTIKFDFSYYLPIQDNNLAIYKLPRGKCVDNNFVLSVICENLVPGNQYQISYQLLNPGSNPGNKVNVFDPGVENIYASFTTQNFATLIDLNVIGEYILQATVLDVANNLRSSAICTLQCGDPMDVSPSPTPTPTVTPSRFSRQNNVTLELLDPGYEIVNDSIIVIPSGTNSFPLVALAKNTIVGYKYNYEFFEVPASSLIFEKKTGEFYSGSVTQNFNSKISFSNQSEYAFVYATITDSESNITKYSEPLLFQIGTDSATPVSLPSGIDLAIGAPSFKSCALRGLTNASISSINGGKGFAIGDKLAVEGGGGYGGELQIISGGITIDTFSSFSGGSGYNIGDYIAVTGGGGTGGLIQIISGGITAASINLETIGGCSGFSIGDLLTTVGGGGQDAVIEVTATGLAGTVTGINVLNPGYGYTFAPNGLVSLNSSGSCSNVTFNADNFAITAAGGITSSSIQLEGGTGYNIGDIIDVVGGGGSGAQIQVLTGSLSTESIDSLSGGANYTVGDLLTTTGGEGSGVVIRVTSVNPATGAITGWELVNGGYGFTGAPTGLSVLQCSSGNCTAASLTANDDNFGISSAGGITKDSISGLINSGIDYEVGDKLILVGGGGSGAVIQITSVNNNGKILDFVILSNGSGYTSSPVVVNENNVAIVPQPTFNTANFTDAGFVIIDAGSGYINTPTQLVAATGDGSGVIASFNVGNFTSPCFVVVNSGSGYTSAPTGLQVISGDGSGATATFNGNNFTIPPVGAITPESISLSGGIGYDIGEILNIVGGGGSGAQVKILSGSLTTASITSLTGGSGYVAGDLLLITGGGGADGLIRVLAVNNTGGITSWDLVNGGYGFTTAPTGISTVTGSGSGATFVGNASNFTISPIAGITSASISGLIGTNTGIEAGDILFATGGGGFGGQVLITDADPDTGSILSYVVLHSGAGYTGTPTLTTLNGVAIGTQPTWNSSLFTSVSYVIINSGSGYTSSPTSVVSANGNGSGAVITSDPNLFSKLAVNITDPGSGYMDAPTGVSVLTGYGNISDLSVVFNDKNFIELVGPAPSPSPTPTHTPTPSMSEPAKCNDLQNAGGQNEIYILNLALPVASGQSYVIVDNLPANNDFKYSVLKGQYLNSDTHIVSVENYYRTVDDTAGLKKITMNYPTTGFITTDNTITLYTVDTRLIQTSYWPGTMTLYYDAYSVPDRFKVIGIPIDKTKPEVLLYDTGFVGSGPCGYASSVSGIGAGSASINKPDGMIYIKMVVEAPCEGTAWNYLLSCPIRNDNLLSSTPTPTPTRTPTLTPSVSSSPSIIIPD